jgi:hypothetical protein
VCRRQAAADLLRRHRDQLIKQTPRALRGVSPKFIERRNHRVRSGSRNGVGPNRLHDCAGLREAYPRLCYLSFATQQRRTFTNFLDLGENATLSLFKIVGDTIGLSVFVSKDK